MHSKARKHQQEEDERREARAVGTGFGGQNAPLPKEIPKHLHEHFRLGGWFCRFPRAPEGEQGPKPNRGSNRPVDIHTVVWCRTSQIPQARELQCRRAEANGDEPPEVPDESCKSFLKALSFKLLTRSSAEITFAPQRQMQKSSEFTAARVEAERRQAAENDRHAAATERAQYSNWDRNVETPTFFLKPRQATRTIPKSMVPPAWSTRAGTKGQAIKLLSILCQKCFSRSFQRLHNAGNLLQPMWAL